VFLLVFGHIVPCLHARGVMTSRAAPLSSSLYSCLDAEKLLSCLLAREHGVFFTCDVHSMLLIMYDLTREQYAFSHVCLYEILQCLFKSA
jgi:hypothetical protein